MTPSVSGRFTRAIVIHLVKNLLPQESTRSPLVLGIHGPTGEGKTYQCEHTLNAMGVHALLISGGQFESPNAGEPAQLIRKTYLKAGKLIQDRVARAVAMVINDIDTGLGDWGPLTQTTINRQTVIGELMHLADYPNDVEGVETRRVPIFITGNDFTKLYAPLLRAGRMELFEWRPNLDEKVDVVATLFPELSRENVALLVAEFDKEPIAFFAQLRSAFLSDSVWNHVGEWSLDRIVLDIHNTPFLVELPSNPEEIIRRARELVDSSRVVNHLKSS